MQTLDRVPLLKGHWQLAVMKGDPERAPLTRDQIAENEYAAAFQRDLGMGIILPVHVGRILNPIEEVLEGENLVTTAGKGLILDRLFALGTPPTQVNSMGVGNSATAAAVGDTQLLGATPAPDLRAFDALPTRSGLVVTAKRTYATAEGNMTWNELGMFNGTTNGTSVLLNRIAPIGPFTKTSAVSIEVTVTLTQS